MQSYYYQNEHTCNNIISANNLPKIKDETYVINLHDFKSIETYWIPLYLNDNNRRVS